MAGNSRRAGAVRSPGSKKPRTVGSGGQRRQSLEGKGPTPPAWEREGHPAKRRVVAAVRRGQPGKPSRPGPTTGSTGPTGPKTGSDRSRGSSSAKKTGRQQPELVVGRNAVLESLREAVPAVQLLVQQSIELDQRVRSVLGLAQRQGIPITEVTKPELDRQAGAIPHQGLILQASAYEYRDYEDLLGLGSGPGGLLVATDSITDPRNLGAIARSALAFGAAGIVIPQRRSVGVTPTVWRSSAGAVARLPVARVTNLTRAIQAAQARQFTVIGLDGDGEAELDELELGESPAMLVAGSEGAGLSRLVGQTCDIRVRIPMSGPMESLNVSVAVGVALYALSRS